MQSFTLPMLLLQDPNTYGPMLLQPAHNKFNHSNTFTYIHTQNHPTFKILGTKKTIQPTLKSILLTRSLLLFTKNSIFKKFNFNNNINHL